MTSKSVGHSIKDAGGTTVVARHCNVEPATVSGWIERSKVPAKHCPEIEKLSRGAVLCEELNSDVDWAFIRGTKRKLRINAPHP